MQSVTDGHTDDNIMPVADHTTTHLAPLKSFDIIALYKFDYYYYSVSRQHSLLLSAVLAIIKPSVCPSVCHTLALCQNDSSYDGGVFTGAP